MKGRIIYGAPEDNFLIEHGNLSKTAGEPAVSIEIGTEKVGVSHTFTDALFLMMLGEAMIRAGEALAVRREDAGL